MFMMIKLPSLGANQAMLDAISLTEHLMRHLSIDTSDVSTPLLDLKHLNVIAALKVTALSEL